MKKRKIGKWYFCMGGCVVLFLLTVALVCYHFYQKNAKLEREISKRLEAEANMEDKERLYLEYIGLENIPFLQKENDFVKEYEKYIKLNLGFKKVHTTIFFANYEKLSENTYLLYSQIDDASSTVLQTVCNIKTHTFDISRCEKTIENIVDLGGVEPGGEQRLSDKYKTKEKAVYAKIETVDGVETSLPEEEMGKLYQTVQRYAYEKYKNTDIEVTLIKLTEIQKVGEYQIYTFSLDDLVQSEVDIYYERKQSICFSIER